MDTIKKNIKIFVLITIILSSSMSLAYNYYKSTGSFGSLSKIFINNTVSNAAERCNDWLAGKTEIADALVGYLKLNKPSDIFNYQDYFFNAVESFNLMDITVGFEDGTVTAGMPEGLPEGYDHRVRDWYKNAIKSQSLYISEPYIDATTGFPCITICVPLTIDGKRDGVFSFDLDFSAFDNMLLYTMNFIPGAYPFLLTSSGNIIIHERKDFTLKNITELSPAYEGVIPFISNHENSGKPYTFMKDGVSKTIVSKKLNYNDWYIMYEMPTSLITTDNTNTNVLIAVLIFIILGASVAIFILYQKKNKIT